MTNLPDNAACPRCAAAFRCGASGAAPCPCARMDLGAATLEALRGAFTGCLCLVCLAELAADSDRPASEPTTP